MFKIIKATFIFEFKRLFSSRVVMGTFLVLFLLSMMFIRIGVMDYKDKISRKAQFQENERLKVSQYMTYTQYGTYGYRIMNLPPSMYILFVNSGVFSEMIAFVDSGERLRIDQPLIGATIFKTIKFPYADFAGILMVFGSLMALFYSCDAMRGIDFIKTLASLTSPFKIFAAIATARVLILIFSLLIVIGSGLLFARIDGVYIPVDKSFSHFLFMIVPVCLFFFALGSVFGTVSTKKTPYFFMLTTWFTLMIIFPVVGNFYSAYKSKLIKPLDRLEMEKLKLVMGFEKRAIKMAGTFDYGKSVTDASRAVILSYYNNEFKKIHDLEIDMQKHIKDTIYSIYNASLFCPTTFYMSSASEFSGMGYGELIDFYRYVQESKKKFFKFYMDMLYFSKNASNFAKIESFIKGDENVVTGKSRLTGFYYLGVSVTLFYTLLLLILSFYLFKKRLFQVLPTYFKSKGPIRLEFKKGQFNVVDTEENIFLNQLYTVMSGARGLQPRVLERRLKNRGIDCVIIIDGVEITNESKKMDFFYVCHPNSIPCSVSYKALISYFGELMNVPSKEITEAVNKTRTGTMFNELDKKSRGDILLTLLKMNTRDYILVNDATRSMSLEFAVHLKEILEQSKENGKLSLLLTGNGLLSYKNPDEGIAIYDSTYWAETLERYQDIFEIRGVNEPGKPSE